MGTHPPGLGNAPRRYRPGADKPGDQGAGPLSLVEDPELYGPPSPWLPMAATGRAAIPGLSA
jgi:hypothetical protein